MKLLVFLRIGYSVAAVGRVSNLKTNATPTTAPSRAFFPEPAIRRPFFGQHLQRDVICRRPQRIRLEPGARSVSDLPAEGDL
jgi:hypothetical protein